MAKVTGVSARTPLADYSWRALRWRLLVRPKPFCDEAGWGYLLRVASANGFDGLRALRGVLVGNRDGDTTRALCVGARLPRTALGILIGPYPSYWRANAHLLSLDSRDFNHTRMRWCPLCLKQEAYLRGVWSLKLVCTCHSHGVWLEDSCPECRTPQYLDRADLCRCACGARLGHAPARMAPAEVLRLNKTMTSELLKQNQDMASPLLDGRAWHRLIRYLGQFDENSEPQRPGQISDLHELAVAQKLVTITADLLAHWPENFKRLLANIQDRQKPSASIRRTFGRLYFVLYSHLADEQFQFLRDAFETHLHESWRGFVGKRNRSLKVETVARHPHVTVKKLARQIRMRPALIKHLLHSRHISGLDCELPSGRHVRSIHRGDANKMTLLARGSMTLMEAASLLALPERRLRELVAAELVIPIISRSTSTSAIWLFQRTTLNPFAAIAGTSRNDARAVSLKQILKTWRLRDGEFVALVKAIMGKELVPVMHSAAPIGELVLDANAVRAWLNAQRVIVKSWLSVDHAARLLAVKQQVAYGLVAKGLLRSTAEDAKNRRISMADVQVFRDTYVSLAEVARRRSTSPKCLLQTLKSSPVCGPSVDGSRQYFFRRADLCSEELLPVTGAGAAQSL